jgi:hypothetical protein
MAESYRHELERQTRRVRIDVLREVGTRLLVEADEEVLALAELSRLPPGSQRM